MGSLWSFQFFIHRGGRAHRAMCLSILKKYTGSPDIEVIRREASASQLKIYCKFLGPAQARLALKKFKGRSERKSGDIASPEFIAFVEQTLTGHFWFSFGQDPDWLRYSASHTHHRWALNEMLNQTKEILAYSTALEDKNQRIGSG